DRPPHLVRRGLVELADAEVTVGGLEQLVAEACDPDALALELEIKRLVEALPGDGQADARAGTPAHALHRLLQALRIDWHAVHRQDRVPAPDAGTLRRRAVDRGDDLELAVAGRDLDADARVPAGGADADLAVLVFVQELGVRVQPRDHAADRAFEELGVVDRLDVVGLDPLHDLGEQPRLLPGQGLLRGLGRAEPAVLRPEAKARNGSQSEHEHARESQRHWQLLTSMRPTISQVPRRHRCTGRALW